MTYQWPAQRVLDAARLVLGWINLPQLLEADAVALRLAVFTQLERRIELLGQVTVTALAEYRALRFELHATFECIFG